MSRSLLALALLLLPALASAQPTISNVTGTFTHGQTLTLTVANAGSGSAPFCWDDFEDATLDAAAHLSPGCDWGDVLNEHDPTTCDDRVRPGAAQTKNLCSHWDDNDTTTQGSSSILFDAQMNRVWLDFWYYLDSASGSNYTDGQLNIKIFRMNADALVSEFPNAYLSTQYGPASSGDTFCRVTDGEAIIESSSCAPGTLAHNGNISNNEYTGTQFWNNWRHYQLCIGVSTSNNSDGTWILYIDGALRYNRPANVNLTPEGFTENYERIYLGNYIRTDPNGFDGDIRGYTQAPLIGNGCARVELSNHQTYASATLREPCPTITWSGSTITCELNRGGHAADAAVYVHVCTDANSCSNGYAITLGGAGGGPSNGAGARGFMRRVSNELPVVVAALAWRIA